VLAHGRWFSPGTPASSTTKTGRHDIAEILLKVVLNTKNQSITKQLNNRQSYSYKTKIDQGFSGGRSRSTRREPPTMGKQLVNFITCGCESSAPFFVIYKDGREPTPYW
jgi:hypothetical protein